MIRGNWNGQNIPRALKEPDGKTIFILPVLECFLDNDEDTVTDLLPSVDSYGWGDNLTNNIAWANNAYRIVDFEPDFSRYGCLPAWFPCEDRHGRRLTKQGQVDRFLFMLDYAYGGLLDDHHQVDARLLVEAILELKDDGLGEYESIEEGENIEWEIEEEGKR